MTYLDTLIRRHVRYQEQAFLTEGQSVGPVPVDLFLEKLLPLIFKSADDAEEYARLKDGVGLADWSKVPEIHGEKEVVSGPSFFTSHLRGLTPLFRSMKF